MVAVAVLTRTHCAPGAALSLPNRWAPAILTTGRCFHSAVFSWRTYDTEIQATASAWQNPHSDPAHLPTGTTMLPRYSAAKFTESGKWRKWDFQPTDTLNIFRTLPKVRPPAPWEGDLSALPWWAPVTPEGFSPWGTDDESGRGGHFGPRTLTAPTHNCPRPTELPRGSPHPPQRAAAPSASTLYFVPLPLRASRRKKQVLLAAELEFLSVSLDSHTFGQVPS